MQKKDTGFTFIELIIVVALVSLIGTFGAAFYSRFVRQTAVQSAGDQISAQLRRAQFLAMMSRQNSNWGVQLSGKTLTLYSGVSFTARTTAFDETTTFSSSVKVQGLDDINFSRISGLPNKTTTIIIGGEGLSETLTLSRQGVSSP